jgi:lambda repressor-like predicted transcriptional regulator
VPSLAYGWRARVTTRRARRLEELRARRVEEIRAEAARGVSFAALAEQAGLSRQRIEAIVTGRKQVEYRRVICERIGRPLDVGETVHHADQNPGNNDPENLWLFADRASHLAWHRILRREVELDVTMPAVRVPAK